MWYLCSKHANLIAVLNETARLTGMTDASLTRHLFKHLDDPMYTDHIYNSAILNNNVSLPSTLCAGIQVKKMALQMKP